jgi:hypothetical protein
MTANRGGESFVDRPPGDVSRRGWRGLAGLLSRSRPTIWILFGCLAWSALAQVNPNNVGGSPNRSPASSSNGGRANGAAHAGTPARGAGSRAPASSPAHVYSKKAGAWAELRWDVVTLETGSTPGIVKGTVSGAHSETRLVATSELSLRVPDGATAARYQLLRLHAENDQRTFRAATAEGLRTSGPSEDAVKFTAKDVAPNTFLLSFPALMPGEYGLLGPLSGESPGRTGRLCTFRVVKP